MAEEDFDVNMHQIRIDKDPVNGTFVGFSNSHSSSEADAAWLIKRIFTSGNFTNIEYAINPISGRRGFFDNVWNDRLNLFGAPPFSNSKSIFVTASNEHIIYNLDPAALKFTNIQPFSISVWFKTFSSSTMCVLGKQANGNDAGYRIEISSGRVELHISGGAAGNRIEIRSSAATYGNGLWHHVVCSYAGDNNANNCKMTIDGVADTFTVNANTLSSTIDNAVNFQISGRNATTNTFDGFIDEVSIWRANLTLTQAQELYGVGVPTDVSQASFNTGASGLGGNFALWNRCGDNTTIPNFTDLSGNGNTGTSVNMTQANIVGEVP